MTTRLASALRELLPDIDIFVDVEGIAAGADWTKTIERQLLKSNAALAIIGREWSRFFDTRLGSADEVLRELAVLYAHKRPVLPVLVDGARMPSAKEMPPEIAQLQRVQAFSVASASFRKDVSILAQRVTTLVHEYGDSYYNYLLESEREPPSGGWVFPDGEWETRVSFPDGSRVVLRFAVGVGADVRGTCTSSSDDIRHPFVAKWRVNASPGGSPDGLVLEGFIQDVGNLALKIPIVGVERGIHTGTNESGWHFWSQLA